MLNCQTAGSELVNFQVPLQPQTEIFRIQNTTNAHTHSIEMLLNLFRLLQEKVMFMYINLFSLNFDSSVQN